ncbi:MAG: sigma-70 family RNA polymerase sigma factor [Chitinispirillaceae bacterium]|nr:sigma-70 family RNA polymerase sigma factor [Chitinispirillaceae bacterium]
MSREPRYDNRGIDRCAVGSCGESGDDWDLVLLCRNEKDRFFPLLMKRHYALVVNMGYRFFSDRGMAEDMAQEVFLKVYHQLDSLEPGRQPFVHWLCRITSNCCRSLYRKRSSEKRALEAGKADFWYDGDATDPADRIDDETAASVKLVNDTLQRIKPDERMALILSHISGLKTREIAPVLQVPEYTVRRLLRRAGGKLRSLLTQQNLEQYARS